MNTLTWLVSTPNGQTKTLQEENKEFRTELKQTQERLANLEKVFTEKLNIKES